METRNCTKCHTDFILDSDDFGFYEKMGVPAPKICPDCRFKRRVVWRNERTLYKRNCDMCSRSIITMYNPSSPYTVYCNGCWASDKWDPASYGLDYDKDKTFFEQLGELIKKVPKSATYSSPATGPNINSEYTNFAGGNKDGYLIFNSGPDNENCAYSRGISHGRDVFDVYFAHEVERVYTCINVQKSANVAWAQNSNECVDSAFLLNCVSCQDCFGCINLRYKSYHFLNEQLSREEYKKKVEEIMGSYKKIEEFKEIFYKHSLKFPRRQNNNFKSVDCTGDYIFESKNCQNCFEMTMCEDMKHSCSIKFAKGCYDIFGHGRKAELMLEGIGIGLGQRVLGSWWVENSNDVEYSLAIRSSGYCFGCDALKGASRFILNKQYDEKEYQELRRHIIEELKGIDAYGIFLPPELAMFAYNETIGQDNFPLTKEEAFAQGFRWEDNVQKTVGKETIKPEDVPDRIDDVSDSITNEVFACIGCARNYKIIKPELAFYKRMKIPLPRKCFNCRFENLILKRGEFRVYDRNCDKCGIEMKTSYSPEKPEIVYCEFCYQREVI